jgi:hypothetical protein
MTSTKSGMLNIAAAHARSEVWALSRRRLVRLAQQQIHVARPIMPVHAIPNRGKRRKCGILGGVLGRFQTRFEFDSRLTRGVHATSKPTPRPSRLSPQRSGDQAWVLLPDPPRRRLARRRRDLRGMDENELNMAVNGRVNPSSPQARASKHDPIALPFSSSSRALFLPREAHQSFL